MPEDGKTDDNRINIDKDSEIKYWSEKLKVTPAWLLAAVKKVGLRVEDVQDWLRHNMRKARGK